MEYGKIKVLETSSEVENYKHLECGYEEIELTSAEAKRLFKALAQGKSIGWSDGEYTHLITIKN